VFYIFSKLFWLVFDPLALGIILLALAGVMRMLRFRRLALAGAVLSGLILSVTSFTTIGAWALSPLETRFPMPEPPERIAGIIVLGGGLNAQTSGATGRYDLNDAGDRYTEAMRLARLYPDARVVITGGVGNIDGVGEGDGVTGARLLTDLGLDPARLITESRSRNTEENAIETEALLAGREGEGPWLLVTSAYHMPRSVGLFRRTGLDILPWPIDHRTPGRLDAIIDPFQPHANAFLAAMALREWIGLVAYWATGRIDEPFPDP
jgi:uncharacterized SAM-binding protein YcdF (DUF218 family)